MTTPKHNALVDEAIVSASFAGAQSVEEILDGIDKDECEYDKGWWETSYGAEFGARKKKEILEAFEACFEDGVKAERERIAKWLHEHATDSANMFVSDAVSAGDLLTNLQAQSDNTK